jgi:hypothetical protein
MRLNFGVRPLGTLNLQVTMPRIPDELLNCALYLYPSESAAQTGEARGGSGFIVTAWDTRADNRGMMYAVTAAHVIGQACVLRFNHAAGKPMPVRIPEDRWHRSPTHDVAIAPLHGVATEELDIFLMPASLGLTRQRTADDNIGVGDNVFIVGRFLGHDGKEKNLPTVRFGSIAMMPREPVRNHITGFDEESILIEVHSAAGYSGSPVFSYRGDTLRSETRLLGLVWGHIEHRVGRDSGATSQNSGIAAVVPSWALLDLLYDHEVVAERARMLGVDQPGETYADCPFLPQREYDPRSGRA